MSDCAVVSFVLFFGSPTLRVGRWHEGDVAGFLGVWFVAGLLAWLAGWMAMI
jgi:hypothetical protein